jgi:transposase-like protein
MAFPLNCFPNKGGPTLIPPYCPNSSCKFHLPNDFDFYSYDGKYRIRDQVAQRYKCKNCNKRFSEVSFKLDYCSKKRGLFKEIFDCVTAGMSNRSVARKLGVAESCVRNKIKILSRQSLLQWEKKNLEIDIKESVAFDGFETFVFSQYHPNNINHVVGSESLFLYDFSYSGVRSFDWSRPL